MDWFDLKEGFVLGISLEGSLLWFLGIEYIRDFFVEVVRVLVFWYIEGG